MAGYATLPPLRTGAPVVPALCLCIVRRWNSMASAEPSRFSWELVRWGNDPGSPSRWQLSPGYDYAAEAEIVGWLDLPDAAWMVSVHQALASRPTRE